MRKILTSLCFLAVTGFGVTVGITVDHAFGQPAASDPCLDYKGDPNGYVMCQDRMRKIKALTDAANMRDKVYHPPPPAPIYANQFADGKAAFIRNDYQTAIKLWQPLADQGNAKAQNDIGAMYENGLGVEQDKKEAVKWFRKAAEQGDAKAQYNLGYVYWQGVGVTRDYTQARLWFQKSANQGNVAAKKMIDALNWSEGYYDSDWGQDYTVPNSVPRSNQNGRVVPALSVSPSAPPSRK